MSASLSPAGATLKRFALQGRSAVVDPRTDAVRRDLADVRLAQRFFAPHYAAPLPRVLTRETALRAGPEPMAATLATLAPETVFEVLEYAGGLAWGVAPAAGLVGYLDQAALADAAA
jgi:hypothetical protein